MGAAAMTEMRMKYRDTWINLESAKSASRIFLLLESSRICSYARSAKIR